MVDSSRASPQVGYGTEETHFALELTYNYGVPSYENGNDLRCVLGILVAQLQR